MGEMTESDDVKSIAETSKEERWRMAAIFSYILVLIGFGLPLWWFTTRVYRAPLPLEEMLELRPEPLPPLEIFIHAATADKTRLLINDMNHILGSSVTLISANNSYLPPSGSLLLEECTSCSNDLTFSPYRSVYFRSGVGGGRLARLVQSWPGMEHDTALVGSQHQAEDGRKQAGPVGDVLRAFPAAKVYDVMVTVVENDGRRLNFNIEDSIAEYLVPFLQSLSPVANFSVKSSVLRYATLGVRGRRVGASGALAEALLAHGVAPLETRLAGHLARQPQVHLVLYITPCSETPLYIYTRAGTRSPGPIPAFISPRWGGVQILNPECEDPRWAPDLGLVMAGAATQLSKLLGVPGAPQGSHLAASDARPAQWQIDWMIRARTKEYLDSARLTLRSLAQLLSEISNIVISDAVARRVESAVEASALAQAHLGAGGFEEALHWAQLAAEEAETAFTDPTLLALLYFPDDQKYAIYIPLFLPVMIPVIMSMRQLVGFVKKSKN